MVTVCREQFNQSLRQFVAISKETPEPWDILQAPSPNDGFIYGSMVITRNVEQSIDCSDDLDEREFALSEGCDLQTVLIPSNDRQIVRFTYHILFNESFSVPVLYFHAALANGSLLSLNQIWKLIPSVYIDHSFSSKEEQSEALLSIISPTEHPYLGTPVYHMHPCQVSTLLVNAFRSVDGEVEVSKRRVNIILTWLSSVGPLIGLKLDNYFAVSLEEAIDKSLDCLDTN